MSAPPDPTPLDGGDELAVALSGGGYRAALLALGALLALVDRGLNGRVATIASVSGGSITNAVVAARVEYRDLRPGDLDGLATTTAADLTSWRKGVAPIAPLFWVVAIGPAYLAWYHTRDHVPAWAAVLCGALAAVVTTFVLTGPSVSAQLENVFELRPRLGSLTARRCAHDFCVTDLVTGLPVTCSTSGAVARRRTPDGGTVVVPVPRWRLADVVRASAAFPGIPPRLLRFGGDRAGDLGPVGFGADGGIWSNLGMQAFADGSAPTRPVLCVNASAVARPARRCWPYAVPGVALVAALARTMAILGRNTVEPRVEAIDLDLGRWAAERPVRRSSPGAVVAGLVPIHEGVARLAALGVDVGLDRLEDEPWWRELVAADGGRDLRVRTTLGHVSRRDAAALVRRGYANTWLASLAIQPQRTDEQPGADVAVRLGLAQTGTAAGRARRPQPMSAP